MGRVWPRHSHRGRPLNSVVRQPMGKFSRRRVIGVVAFLVGLPVTLLVGLPAIALLVDSLSNVASVLLAIFRGELSSPSWTREFFPLIASAAGILGLVGFWLWFFSNAPPASRKRAFLTILVGCGVLATTVPLLVSPIGFAVLAAIGGITGIGVIIEMWLPNSSFERTK